MKSLRLVSCLLSGMAVIALATPAYPSEPPNPASIDFERDIQPVLTRFACNSGPCHGKQRGQNGFQLSLFGFDSDFDYAALIKESRGRRVSMTRPEMSLLLRKPSGQDPHGGGVRLPVDSPGYQLLLQWIKDGAPRSQPNTPALEFIDVAPTQKTFAFKEEQQLTVTAHFSDGSKRDVTGMTVYQSNDAPIAAVDENGLVRVGSLTGETAVMARYQNHFAIFTATVPLPGESKTALEESGDNFIDQHVWTAMKRLGFEPSEPAPDHKFLRRVYIDIIGRVPTVAEAREFLEDPSPEKREHLVDKLLADSEYAEHWANKWADLLRPNPYHVGIKATLNYDAWIREAFRENMPYDEFVKQLLTSRGSTFRDGETVMFRDRRKPDELTTIVSQLFLGIRLECAKCHHHPFEVYGQSDFYSFAAYFARIGRKGTGISAPISGSEEFIFTADKGDVQHPITNEVLEPRPIFGEAPEIAEGEDRREALAEWLASPENPYFAQTMANRVWTDLMGVGLVEPVDDLRATNPPTNPELLQALGDDFVQSDFNIKKLIRQIVLSKAYAMSTLPQPRNELDTRYYSRKYRQRLRAEVLLDSVVQVTGVPESFSAMAPNAKAKELWTHRIGSLFLDAYGRPDPNQDPPCERTGEPTVVQTLHLMNSENLAQKITSDKGQAAQWGKSEQSPEEIVNEMYLAIYARFPTESELKIALGIYENEGTDRRKVTEDLMWSLMNTPEFTFKD